jgi:hypothetical protein
LHFLWLVLLGWFFFSEYYKIRSVPNTQHILSKHTSELIIWKGICFFYSKWLNNSLSKPKILVQRLHVPEHLHLSGPFNRGLMTCYLTMTRVGFQLNLPSMIRIFLI